MSGTNPHSRPGVAGVAERGAAPLKFWILITLALVLLIYLAMGWSTLREVDRITEMAQSGYGSDAVTALVAFSISEDEPVDRRNQAVWAPGELRRKEALPGLRRLLAHSLEHPHEGLSERELKKAVGKIEGEGVDPYWIIKKIFGK